MNASDKVPASGDSGSVFGQELGQLKIYIGAAPGVGKTYTMLREANALLARGVNVIVGYVDAHDRPDTADQLGPLQVVPLKRIHYRSHVFDEMDLDAICSRHPGVVVIDELAHSNSPGSMFSKRYMDIEFLLDQGISVITAVNVQHLEGISEEAEEIIGVRVREIIPTSFLKRANEIEVVDVTPETLRQRLRDGRIYPTENIHQALDHFFRKSNLFGLRELALRAVAEDVDERLQRSYQRGKIQGPVGAKESIMVCLNDPARADSLMARGQRMSGRMRADLYALHILRTSTDLLSGRDKEKVSKLMATAKLYDAEWILEPRNDRRFGVAIMDVAQRLNVTQIVIGQPVRARSVKRVLTDSPARYLLRHTRYMDLRIAGWEEHIAGGCTQEVDQKPSTKAVSTLEPGGSGRGNLTIYVGSAPGVGKTYKMLRDAHDWKERRGKDVVIGLIETHSRSDTAREIGNLEVIPLRQMIFEGRTYEELDVDAIICRKPQIVLIDELAHSNFVGCARQKRYQDIELLLEHGIHVVTAVNIQHLESLHDKVEHVTGVKVRERVPDWFMRLAHEVKLIDVTPETLQQRLIEGKIYAADKVQQALDHFFCSANLQALREIALLEVADDVDQRITMELDRSKGEQPIKERILVAVNHRPHSEKLIRRGWRLADRLHAELWVLVVLGAHELADQDRQDLNRIQKLSEQFEALFITRPIINQNVGQTIVAVAQELHVSQLVTGQPLPVQGWWAKRVRRNPIDYVLDHASFADLHIVANSRE